MATKQIFQLPAATSVAGAYQFAIDNVSNVSQKVTASQISSYLSGAKSAKDGCVAATTGALTVTYNNGASGVGATLTNADTKAAFTTDGVTPQVGDRLLVRAQADSKQNGIYTLTAAGSGAVNWVMTRATDYNGSANGLIALDDYTVVALGTLYGAHTFSQTTRGPITVGSSNITFATSASASGDVSGPGSSTDTAIVRFSGATGKIIQNSGIIVDSSNNLVTPASLTAIQLFVTPQSITTDISLTTNDFGKIFICTGAVNYTITLPTPVGNSGKMIKLIFEPTSNALIIVDSASGVVIPNGRYGASESATFISDGTDYRVIDITLFPVYLIAHLQTELAITSGTGLVQIPFDSVLSSSPTTDNGYLDILTGTYQPRYSGIYEISYGGLFDIVDTASADVNYRILTDSFGTSQVNNNAMLAGTNVPLFITQTAPFDGATTTAKFYAGQTNADDEDQIFLSTSGSSGASKIQIKRLINLTT